MQLSFIQGLVEHDVRVISIAERIDTAVHGWELACCIAVLKGDLAYQGGAAF